MNKTVKQKLPKRFKDKWVKALRSGKYQQAKHYLYNGKGFCCIGVAANICGVGKDKLQDIELIDETKLHLIKKGKKNFQNY